MSPSSAATILWAKEDTNMFRTIAVLSILIAGALAFACDDNSDGGSPTETAPAEATDLTTPVDTGAGSLPQGNEAVELDPANFVAEIDNPYWPMKPGSRWVYNETDEEGNVLQVEVTVTNDTKEIMGISATVVRDIVTQDGEVIEDTFDWYAQDVDGNIWYMGEDTKEYEDGVVTTTEGSWEAGVDGALAGVLLPGDPQVGMAYRQEYYAGEAEDNGEVLALDAHVEAPYGSFDGCLQTEDTTALDPNVVENKYYCQGVGPVLAVDLESGAREELVTFEEGA
jgi:hypothetical protein